MNRCIVINCESSTAKTVRSPKSWTSLANKSLETTNGQQCRNNPKCIILSSVQDALLAGMRKWFFVCYVAGSACEQHEANSVV